MSLQDKFTDDVLTLLWEDYTVDGQVVKGQAFSYLATELRGMGWKNLTGLEDDLKAAGFVVVAGLNKRNQDTRVVTV